jgi:hypothetical protein
MANTLLSRMPWNTFILSISLELTSLKTCMIEKEFSAPSHDKKSNKILFTVRLFSIQKHLKFAGIILCQLS